jgi:GT2 family glycosyltransferase
MPGTTSPSVAVQVVLFNSKDKLPKLLRGLASVELPGVERVVRFLNNSPGDGAADVIAAALPHFSHTYHDSEQGNIGFGAGHNRLAALHGYDSDFLLLLNPDTIPFFDMPATLLEAASRSSSAALVEAAQFPVEHQKSYDRGTGYTDWCCATSLLVRTTAFRELGGFDQRLFLYCEDVDLSWRAWLAGYECVYVPAAKSVHVSQEEDVGKDRSAEIHHMELGNLYLRNKYFGAAAVEDHLAFLRAHRPADIVDGLWADLERIAHPHPVVARHPRVTLNPDHVNYGPTRW